MTENRNGLLVISPNLALDNILEIANFHVDGVQRATKATLSAGGKGINVARASRHLGVDAHVIGFTAGRIGHLVQELATIEGIELDCIRCSGQTRLATMVLDQVSETTTVLNEPGPVVGDEDWESLNTRARARFDRSRILVCTGSLPQGVPSDGYTRIIREAASSGIQTIADVTGSVLATTLLAKPDIVKINLGEAETIVQMSERDPYESVVDRARAASLKVCRLGAKSAIITAGRFGAAVANRQNTLFLTAPEVSELNAIGAGDSFLAGVSHELLRGKDLVESARFAIAVAACSTETLQPGHMIASRISELNQQIKVVD